MVAPCGTGELIGIFNEYLAYILNQMRWNLYTIECKYQVFVEYAYYFCRHYLRCNTELVTKLSTRIIH